MKPILKHILLAAVLIAAPALAQTSKKISEWPTASSVTGTDVVLGNQGGATKQIPISVLDSRYQSSASSTLFSYRAGDRPAGSSFASQGLRSFVGDGAALAEPSPPAGWHTVDSANGFFAALGDSITWGSTANEGWPQKIVRNLNTTLYRLHYAQLGVPSAQLDFTGTNNRALNLNSIREDYISPTQGLFGQLPGVFVVFAGTNDLKGVSETAVSASTTYTRLVALCNGLRATHPKARIVVCTMLPRENSGLETVRSTYNTSITTASVGAGQPFDAVADVGAHATMGNVATLTNTTYYTDTIHPTDAGQEILYGIINSVVTTQLAAVVAWHHPERMRSPLLPELGTPSRSLARLPRREEDLILAA